MAKKKGDPTELILGQINEALWRHSSWGYIFMHGVVRGLGTALGATVLVAIVTSIAIKFADVAYLDAIIKAVTHATLE